MIHGLCGGWVGGGGLSDVWRFGKNLKERGVGIIDRKLVDI